MTYIKSHNDYWTDPQVQTAVKHNCNIFEADIILLDGDVMIRHSWRPFKRWCCGSLESYLKKMIKYVTYPSVLQIEVKDPDTRIVSKTCKILLDYYPKFKSPITFAMYGGDELNRDKYAKSIYTKLKDKLPIVIWNTWKVDKDITTLDLFHAPSIKWWWY
jgi:hypothetical protein